MRWYENPVVLATHVLTLQQYGLLINAQGALTVENIIPFDEIRGTWVYRNVNPPDRRPSYAWQRLVLREPEPGSYIVTDYIAGDPALRPEFSRLEKLAIDSLNLEFQQNTDIMQDLMAELDEVCEAPIFGQRLWCLLVDEIARLRALNDTEYRICPHCLHDVDVRLTMCINCMAIFVAVGKVDKVVPVQREPSPSTSSSRPDPTAGPSNAEADIREVINQAMEETEEVEVEEEDEVAENQENIPVVFGNDDDVAPEYKDYNMEAAQRDLPLPLPYGIDELGDEKAHNIDSNYLVSLQFDVRLMKNIRRLASQSMEIVCFNNRADVLRKFDHGERHDCLGKRWPSVPHVLRRLPVSKRCAWIH